MEVLGFDDGLGNTSWLVDLGDGGGLVVDPSRDPRPYLDAATARGLTLRFVAETHLHADYVSGGRELVAATDARLLAPADAALAYPHEPVSDTDTVDLGGLRLEAVATPGHTPEHLAWVLQDGGAPAGVFTGGTLIAGGVARPDLVSPDLTEGLARAAWRSLHDRLLTLPDDLAVYPTHGGGSFCAATPGEGRTTTTIGAERRGNPLLAAPSEDEFVARLLGGLGTFPPYFLRLRSVNQRGAPLYGTATPPLRPLSVPDVESLIARGALLIDVRPVEQYAAAHVPGSLSIELRPGFATWLGWLVSDPGGPLVFLVGEGQDRDRLVRDCLLVGYENLAGELAGGLSAWQEAGREIATTRILDRPATDRRPVDVRQRAEWDAEHVPEAVHAELGALEHEVKGLLDEPVIVHCAHGQRAMTGASILERAGHTDVAVYRYDAHRWRQDAHAQPQ